MNDGQQRVPECTKAYSVQPEHTWANF